LHESTGNYERAEQNYKNAISSDASFVAAYVNLAALYGNQGRFAEAKPLLIKAIELDPSASDAKQMLEHINASLSKH
jgi:Tfp pilus assembly protein PilF